MTRRGRRHIVIMIALLVLYFWAEYAAPRAIDWTPTFDPNDTRPYGTMIVNELLPDAFPNATVSADKGLIYTLIRDTARHPHPFNLIIVNSTLASGPFGADFSVDQFDTELLMGFVSEGGSVLLAAEQFSGPLADTLNIDTFRRYDSDPAFAIEGEALATDVVGDSLFVVLPASAPTSLVTFSSKSLSGARFDIENTFATWYFDSVDTLRTSVLGSMVTETEELPNYIRIDHGQGSFFVSTMPYAFTNYAMTDSLIAAWSFAALSHLPVQNTVWTTSYTPGHGHASQTYLRYLLSNKSLRWAWYIVLASGMLFILFRSRRRQRVIPVVEPNENATLGFVDAIGRLYFQRGNHRDLANKKIAHFREYVRTKLGINADSFSDAVVAKVAARSGVSPDRVREVVGAIESASTTSKMSGAALLSLSKEIDEFYRASRR